MSRPITRCYQPWCRTTVDLDDDPAALQECCGVVICDGCTTEHDCEGRR